MVPKFGDEIPLNCRDGNPDTCGENKYAEYINKALVSSSGGKCSELDTVPLLSKGSPSTPPVSSTSMISDPPFLLAHAVLDTVAPLFHVSF